VSSDQVYGGLCARGAGRWPRAVASMRVRPAWARACAEERRPPSREMKDATDFSGKGAKLCDETALAAALAVGAPTNERTAARWV
jgi:hypothetical protein